MLTFQDLQLNAREPVYLQIAAHVKRQIFRKTARTGDPLPSRREIAATLEINPNTAQKAFRLMEDEGYVITNGNSGSVLFVDDTIYARISDELTRDMVLSFIRTAKENGLPFPRVVALVGELWDTV